MEFGRLWEIAGLEREREYLNKVPKTKAISLMIQIQTFHTYLCIQNPQRLVPSIKALLGKVLFLLYRKKKPPPISSLLLPCKNQQAKSP